MSTYAYLSASDSSSSSGSGSGSSSSSSDSDSDSSDDEDGEEVPKAPSILPKLERSPAPQKIISTTVDNSWSLDTFSGQMDAAKLPSHAPTSNLASKPNSMQNQKVSIVHRPVRTTALTSVCSWLSAVTH